MRHGKETIEHVRHTLARLSGDARKRKIHELAGVLDVHITTIYRWASKRRGGIPRLPRADKNTRRTPISQEVFERMSRLTVLYDHPAETVIARAEAAGWIPVGSVHPSTYNRYLRSAGISRRILTRPRHAHKKRPRGRLRRQPHRRFEASASNEIHQIDISELPRHYIDEERAIGYDPNPKIDHVYRDKKPRLHLFVMVDDHSRATYARLYRSKGLDCWLDFMMQAWLEKPNHIEFPFRGLPNTLYGDSDSATHANDFRALMNTLGVKFIPHELENPAAKGKIEKGGIAFLKSYMEREMREEIEDGEGRMSMERAEAMLADILYLRNNRTHTETGVPPIQRWMTGLFAPIRMPPKGKYEWVFYTATERLVRPDLTVSIDGTQYQLPRREPLLSLAATGSKVIVQHHRTEIMSHPLIVSVDGEMHSFPAEIAAVDAAGEWKALPKSVAEKNIEAAYTAPPTNRPQNLYRDRHKTIAFPMPEAPAPAPPIEVTPTTEREMLTKIEVKSRLFRSHLAIDPTEIDQVFGERKKISESEYQAIAARTSAA